MNVLYTPLIGFPLCIMLCMVGMMLCLTIIGIPLGMSCFMLANKVLTVGK